MDVSSVIRGCCCTGGWYSGPYVASSSATTAWQRPFMGLPCSKPMRPPRGRLHTASTHTQSLRRSAMMRATTGLAWMSLNTRSR